jgi:membrane-bound lytic murein transglycosylase B
LRSISGWTLVGLGAVAFGSANAQVEQGAPVHRAQYQPAPRRTSVLQQAPRLIYPAQAQAPTGFEAYKLYLAGRARREGVREATIRSTVPYLRLNARAMELDRAQRPAPRTANYAYMAPFAPYRREHVTASLIRRGQARFAQHWPYLYRIQTSYGVDPAVLMAIYGHETSYGSITGSFDLLEALATLGYEGRRREMFEKEVIATLKLLDGGVSRERLRGSYAGATGYPQFMPTAALRLRVDGDGDGYANIWTNEVDALASMANYLREAGWKRGVPWGVPTSVPSNFNRAAVRGTLAPARCPRVYQRHSRWLTAREWRSFGIVSQGRPLADMELATLIEPDGPGQRAYLLTNNYRAILDYNCSNYYALSVGLLADAIAGR